EGMLYADDPGLYRTRLQQLATVTPAQVRAAMQRWLTRPVYALRVEPGEREAYDEAPGVSGARAGSIPTGAASQRPRYYRPPQQGEQPLAPLPYAQRELPPVSDVPALDFPEVERARLSNGIPVVYARRQTVPVTRVVIEFDAGIAADPADRLGTQGLMLDLLTEGTTRLNSVELAEAQERLGAEISTGASLDRTGAALTALTPTLGESLDLFADVVRNPAFAPFEVERLRHQQLAGIAAEMTEPAGLAARTLPQLLWGPQHPYGKPATGSGDPAVVRSLTRDELVRFHQSWIRPDNAAIFAVGDLPLDQFVELLEARFGNWRPPAVALGTKRFAGPARTGPPRIYLVDRPQSPQSFIVAAQLLPVQGTEDLLLLTAANEVLGGNFLARINMELRERRGWSYGAYGSVSLREHQVPYVIQAPVQADRTGDSIQAIREQLRGFLGGQGVQPNELNRVILGNTRQLPGQFETSGAVLGALRSNALYRRPDDYWERVADRYRSMTAPALDETIRRFVRPDDFIWVVVGDAARVRPQLERLGMPIEMIQPR
ncbi:MAG TPA: pitrilysin family protein, partial [Allosphingosinicella sp.]|nr:pitrilysin family protein [Allosphingosinicella sp.]